MNFFTTQPDPDKKPLFRISGWLTRIRNNLCVDQPVFTTTSTASTNKAAKFTTTSEEQNEHWYSFFPNAVGGNAQRAFTLMEIMVAIAVISIVSSMVFTQRQSFSRSVGLNNVAHEVALAVRQTQSYGVSSRGSELTDSVDNFSYGIYFDSNEEEQFIIYRDTAGNRGYQTADLEIETYTLPGGVEIAGVCVNSGFSDTNCAPADMPGEAVIMFSRPHPNAEFRQSADGLNIPGNTAIILLEEEESGARRKVIVRRSGFITVE